MTKRYGAARGIRRAARRGASALAFRIPLAVIAVAVLDHAFVSREPGTKTIDHVSSGLAPVLVALVLAWAYPRLRPGAQAAAAISCGALALTAAAARLPAHSVTSIVAGLAGAWLLIEGGKTLWRSRRPGLHLGSRLLGGVLIAIAAYLVLLPVAFAILATQHGRAMPAPADVGRAYASVSLTAADGVRLAAWYVPSRNRAAIVAFPGRSGPVAQARLLARHGYGALLLDRRGEGASEGDINLYGWNGEADVRAAVEYLRRRPDVDPDRIGGLGLSVGGELLLQAAAHDRGLRAVVSMARADGSADGPRRRRATARSRTARGPHRAAPGAAHPRGARQPGRGAQSRVCGEGGRFALGGRSRRSYRRARRHAGRVRASGRRFLRRGASPPSVAHLRKSRSAYRAPP